MAATVPADKKYNYEQLFASCVIKPTKYAEIDSVISKIVTNKSRYEAVGSRLQIPWFVIAIIHCMEGSLRFDRHLHNGDPLTKRTVNVPKGMPKSGNPPFTWEVSATDALVYDKLNTWTNWSIAGILYKLEGYNGFGYYSKRINSPYLWSYSNHYIKGKYVQDGKYDANAVSKQIGAAVLLRRLRENQLIILPDTDLINQILAQGKITGFYNGSMTTAAKTLQQLLNRAGAVLRVDGKAGELTSNEYFKFSGEYLDGDSRN